MTLRDVRVDNVALWRGRGDVVEPGMAILIRNGKIAAIGPKGEVPSAGDVTVVDGTGATAIPGLIDAHVHLATNSDYGKVVDNATYRALVSGSEKLLHGVRNGMRALKAGVTTLRVMGHRESGDVELAAMIERGLLPGPRLVVAPWVISMTGGRGDLFYPAAWPRQEFDTADGIEECRKVVRLQRKLGAGFIKVTASAGALSADDKLHWPNYTVEELQVIVSEAHDYDLKVAAHAHSTEGIRRALLAGVDTLEHGSNLDDALIDMMVRQGTWLVPTLAITDSLIRHGAATGAKPEGLAKLEVARANQTRSFSKALAAGVKIAMGTDSSGTLCRFGEHARELELYVEHGMAARHALETATTAAAEALGLADQIGALDVGKCADIVLVNGNPLQDITLLRKAGGLRRVFRAGADVTDPWPRLRI